MGVIVKRSHIKKRAAIVLVGLLVLAVLFLILAPLLGDFLMPLAAMVIIVCVLADFSSFIAYSSTSVENTDRGVVFSSGIINKTKTTYPYSKITSTRIDTSLLNNILGLKTLMLDTAGESSMDLVVEDLPAGDCDRFYREINEKMESTKKQGNE
jgi:uncharacterized membrane protein YdbT with pleckstrin-like domain